MQKEPRLERPEHNPAPEQPAIVPMGIAHLIYAERHEAIADLSLYLLANISFDFNLSKRSLQSS